MLAEVAQTVDDVVIIHRGRLVRPGTIDEVQKMAAGGARVRSPEAARLASLLEGYAVVAADDGALVVDAPPERVGEVAAAHGIVLYELAAHTATLEEVFLELTGTEERL